MSLIAIIVSVDICHNFAKLISKNKSYFLFHDLCVIKEKNNNKGLL